MRVLVLILTLLCLGNSPVLAQDNGQGNGNGQENGNSGGNNGNGPGENSGNGQGNGNAGSNNGNGNGPSENSGNENGNSQASGNAGGNSGNGNGPSNANAGNSGNGPGSGGNGLGASTPANTDANGTVHYSQDDARDAVSAGKAVSLASLLPDLQARAGGEVIDAELLRVQNILVYAIKVLRPDGLVTQEYYYAQSGRFIGSEP